VSLDEHVILGTFARGLCLTKMGRRIEWPRRFDKDPGVIGLGGPAQNLANELANRGYHIEFKQDGHHCEIQATMGEPKYLIHLDSPGDSLTSWAWRWAGGKWLAFGDPSQCSSPTETDRQLIELSRGYPTLRLAQMPPASS